jgi:acid phosphatase type 7
MSLAKEEEGLEAARRLPPDSPYSPNVNVALLFERVLLVCFLSLTLVACGRESPAAPRETPPVVVAAGDIADCFSGGDEATARLLGGIHGTILALGDEVYDHGSSGEFADCYGPTWGRFKDRTKPAPGNHEYETPNAEGYFGYFGEATGNPGEGYYSFDLGDWHLIALNSNCTDVGGCDASSTQGRWLRDDLAKSRRKCTLAYFHHPLFTSGKHRPGIPEVRPLWEALYKAGADVVLNGHDHNYQRFAPQDPEGKINPKGGIRKFVVGTGGKSHYAIWGPIANSEVNNDDTYGVLKLTLRPSSYYWKFVPVAGQSFTDSGTTSCH